MYNQYDINLGGPDGELLQEEPQYIPSVADYDILEYLSISSVELALMAKNHICEVLEKESQNLNVEVRGWAAEALICLDRLIEALFSDRGDIPR